MANFLFFKKSEFTEKWTKDLFSPIARQLGLYSVNSVVCDAIGLPKRSRADLAFCTTNSTNQRPENIKLIFEIKMSIVSNYQFTQPNNVSLIGDYKSPNNVFQTIEGLESPLTLTRELLNQEMNYFSSMVSKPKLEEIILIANQENNDMAKDEKFFYLMGLPIRYASVRAIRYKFSLRCRLSASIPNAFKIAA